MSNEKSSYKYWTSVPLRYSDTDALGHVNNAVFSTLLEQGRVSTFFNGMDALGGVGTTFVIASMKLDFLAEMNFPGTAEIGTKINSFGRSSVKIGQTIYLNNKCCALSEEVMVLIDTNTRKPIEIPAETRKLIELRFQ
ncbi:acyl-CoA thioesterase [bacterium]|nr:acyl-CoA thioesterase [bacterium]